MARADNSKNLIPQSNRTPKEAREMGRNGGVKSGQVRKEKKLIREIYAEFLINKHDLTIDGKKRALTGSTLCGEVIPKILLKYDAASVSLLKEIDRVQMEDLERNRITDNELKIIIDDGENGN